MSKGHGSFELPKTAPMDKKKLFSALGGSFRAIKRNSHDKEITQETARIKAGKALNTLLKTEETSDNMTFTNALKNNEKVFFDKE